MAASIQVVIDCADPDRLAEFWAAALGYVVQPPPEGYESWEQFCIQHGLEELIGQASAVVDPDGTGPRFYFQKVPEPKITKNRVHLDLNLGGGRAVPLDERRQKVDAQVERLIGLGAKKVRAQEQHGEYWTVMQDPEGNEFCVQ